MYCQKKICVHVYGRKKTGKKKICPYNKNHSNCPLYKDWLEIKQTCNRLAENRYKEVFNEEIGILF